LPFTTPAVAFGDPDMLMYHVANGKAKIILKEEWANWATCFPDPYTDKAIQTCSAVLGTANSYPLFARMTDENDFYCQNLYGAASTADHMIKKWVAGAITTLATEAINITAQYMRSLKLSCSGTTISAYRADLTTPKISATDTAHASGYFGVGNTSSLYNQALSIEASMHAKITSADSSVRAVRYFEAPVTGTGTDEDPFRVAVPEKTASHPVYGNINLLAFTHSSLIKTGADGRPVEFVAVVRILEQPDRPAYLNSISVALDEFRAMSGVRELTLDEARARAKKLDDLLTDEDLKEWR